MRPLTSAQESPQPATLPAGFLEALAAELDGPDVAAVVLGGSFARGAATTFSDVDLAPIYREGAPLPPKRLFWRDGWLVSVSPKTVAAWRERLFQPEWAIFLVPSAARLRILLDKDGAIAAFVAEAQAFRWGPLQPAADTFAGDMLMFSAENALKLLGALARGEEAAIPSALGEILYSLTCAVATQCGVMIETESTFYRQVQASVGVESAWSRALHTALGFQHESLRERAAAALRLYAETARLLASVLQPPNRDEVAATVERIATLGYA